MSVSRASARGYIPIAGKRKEREPEDSSDALTRIRTLVTPYMHIGCGDNFSEADLAKARSTNRRKITCPGCNKGDSEKSFVYNRALESALRSLQTNDSKALQHLNNARDYSNNKNYIKALEQAKEGLKIPCNDETKSSLSSLLYSCYLGIVEQLESELKKDINTSTLKKQEAEAETILNELFLRSDQKFDLLQKLSSLFQNLAKSFEQKNNLDEALENYEKAKEFIEKAKNIPFLDPNKKLKLLIECGEIYNKLGLILKAQKNICMEDHFHKSIELKEKALDHNLLTADQKLNLLIDCGLLYFSLGYKHYNQKDYNNAIKCYNKAIEFNEKALCLPSLNPSKRLQLLINCGTFYHHLGYFYGKLEDYKNAIKCYSKAIELIEKALNLPHLLADQKLDLLLKCGSLYNNLGQKYDEKGDYENVIKCYNKAKEYKEKALAHPSLESSKRSNLLRKSADIYHNLGYFYGKFEDYKNAIECYSKAIKLIENNLKDTTLNPSQKLMFLLALRDSYYNIGSDLWASNDTENATKNLNKSIDISNIVLRMSNLDSSQKSDIFIHKSDTYDLLGNFYLKLEKYQESIKNFDEEICVLKKALQSPDLNPSQKLEISITLGDLYQKLAHEIFGKLKNTKKEIENLKISEQVHEQNLKDQKLNPEQKLKLRRCYKYSCERLGDLYTTQNNLTEAQRYFNKAKTL